MCRRGTGLSCRWAQGRVAAVAPPVASTGTPADDSVQLPNVLVQFESTALPIPLSLRLHNNATVLRMTQVGGGSESKRRMLQRETA